MLDQEFCTLIEYEICKAFENSDQEEVKSLWCDGVLLSEPDKHYSRNT